MPDFDLTSRFIRLLAGLVVCTVISPLLATAEVNSNVNAEFEELKEQAIELLKKENELLKEIEQAALAAIEQELSPEEPHEPVKVVVEEDETTELVEIKVAHDELAAVAKEIALLREEFAQKGEELGDLKHEIENMQKEFARERRQRENLMQQVRRLESSFERHMQVTADSVVKSRQKDTRVSYLDSEFEADRQRAVVKEKEANLVISPNQSERVLGVLEKNAKLLIETRKNDWYRVVTQEGQRGWINGSQLLFPASGQAVPGQVLRVHAVDASDPQ